jgi:primosomal replication protein N
MTAVHTIHSAIPHAQRVLGHRMQAIDAAQRCRVSRETEHSGEGVG